MNDGPFYRSPAPVLLAEKTRKARAPGTCILDGCSIFVGDRIGLIPALGWGRVPCIVRHNRDAAAQGGAKEGTPCDSA